MRTATLPIVAKPLDHRFEVAVAALCRPDDDLLSDKPLIALRPRNHAEYVAALILEHEAGTRSRAEIAFLDRQPRTDKAATWNRAAKNMSYAKPSCRDGGVCGMLLLSFLVDGRLCAMT